MNEIVTEAWWSLAVRGAAALLFGILTLVWPAITLWALVLLFGGYALVDGVTTLGAVVIGDPDARGRRGRLLLHALVGIAVGIATFAWPDITALALLYLVAAWAFLTGVLEIAAAVELRRIRRRAWVAGVIGALSVAVAALLVVRPGDGALAVTWAIGWFAVVSGVTYLAVAWQARKLLERFEGRTGGARAMAA
jgi:uncharacterized membrane protein HdeD (DUF308 family)